MAESVVHNYLQRGWGHDYSISEIDGLIIKGHIFSLRPLSEGDLFLLKHEKGGRALYEFTDLRRSGDPRDMYFYEARWAPERRGEVSD